MKRARSSLFGLAGVVLLGTVLLWVGTRRTMYSWGTNSLPGERSLEVLVGAGRIGYESVNMKLYPDYADLEEGFGSYPVPENMRMLMDEEPAFGWVTPVPGFVGGWFPIWFPGVLVGGLLLGWGLLYRGDEEADPEPEELLER